MTRVPHFRGDVEKGRLAGIGEDDGRNGGYGFCESWAAEELVVGLPRHALWRCARTRFEADSDGHSEALFPISLVASLYHAKASRQWIDLPAIMMDETPTQAIQPILWSVCMLARLKATIAATATKTAVQVACMEMALRAIETLNMADPDIKMKTADKELVWKRDSVPHSRKGKSIKGWIWKEGSYRDRRPRPISHDQHGRT